MLTIGGTVVIMRRWDPNGMLALIERERVLNFSPLPSFLDACHERGLPKLRFARQFCDPLPILLLQDYSRAEFMKPAGGVPVIHTDMDTSRRAT